MVRCFRQIHNVLEVVTRIATFDPAVDTHQVYSPDDCVVRAQLDAKSSSACHCPGNVATNAQSPLRSHSMAAHCLGLRIFNPPHPHDDMTICLAQDHSPQLGQCNRPELVGSALKSELASSELSCYYWPMYRQHALNRLAGLCRFSYQAVPFSTLFVPLERTFRHNSLSAPATKSDRMLSKVTDSNLRARPKGVSDSRIRRLA